jgi:hypothetical protein
MNYWERYDFGASPNPRQLRREKIDPIKRGDDFATNDQLLQIVAIAQLLVAKNAQPKICVDIPVCVGLDQGGWNEHGDFLSTARATPPVGGNSKSQSPSPIPCGSLGFGTWDFS